MIIGLRDWIYKNGEGRSGYTIVVYIYIYVYVYTYYTYPIYYINIYYIRCWISPCFGSIGFVKKEETQENINRQ